VQAAAPGGCVAFELVDPTEWDWGEIVAVLGLVLAAYNIAERRWTNWRNGRKAAVEAHVEKVRTPPQGMSNVAGDESFLVLHNYGPATAKNVNVTASENVHLNPGTYLPVPELHAGQDYAIPVMLMMQREPIELEITWTDPRGTHTITRHTNPRRIV
jgi:hypothetical protein